MRFLPLPLFIAVSFALHAWLAAAGTYLAARVLRVSRLAALAAGAAILCGRLFVSFEDMAYSLDMYRLAWLPLIAACALRSAERPTWLPRRESPADRAPMCACQGRLQPPAMPSAPGRSAPESA